MSRHPVIWSKGDINNTLEEDINAVVQLNLLKSVTRNEIALYTEKDSELSLIKKEALLINLDLDSWYKSVKN